MTTNRTPDPDYTWPDDDDNAPRPSPVGYRVVPGFHPDSDIQAMDAAGHVLPDFAIAVYSCAQCGARHAEPLPAWLLDEQSWVPDLVSDTATQFNDDHEDCTRTIPDLPDELLLHLPELFNYVQVCLQHEKMLYPYEVSPSWFLGPFTFPDKTGKLTVLPAKALPSNLDERRSVQVRFASLLRQMRQTRNAEFTAEPFVGQLLAVVNGDDEEAIMLQFATATQGWVIVFPVTREPGDGSKPMPGTCATKPAAIFPPDILFGLDGAWLFVDPAEFPTTPVSPSSGALTG